MGIQVVGTTAPGNIADVNASGALKVAGEAFLHDSYDNEIQATENGTLKTSIDSLLFFEQTDGANVNTNLWNQSTLTQTIAQASGFVTLNSGSSVAVNTYSILSSIKAMPIYGQMPLYVAINAKTANLPLTNATCELGLGTAATNAAPTDGAFFRWKPDGTFAAVINNNGTETTSANLTGSFSSFTGDETVVLPPTAGTTYLYEIVLVEDVVQFVVNDVLVAEVAVPTTQNFPVNAGRQTVMARVYNGAVSPASAPQLSIGQVVVNQQALNQNKLWKESLTSLGRGAYQSPVTAFGQTANHTNSTSPTSATLSNTAAGYTTLGGRFQFAAVAGAATDFALFAFQVPVGYQLYITGLRMDTVVTGAAIATTATVLDWSVAVNSSAVSLATADGAGTWAPRRIPIGIQGFSLVAPTGPKQIGDSAEAITFAFDPPLVVDSQRFFHIILQVPVGTATASQVFRGVAGVTGYFE